MTLALSPHVQNLSSVNQAPSTIFKDPKIKTHNSIPYTFGKPIFHVKTINIIVVQRYLVWKRTSLNSLYFLPRNRGSCKARSLVCKKWCESKKLTK